MGRPCAAHLFVVITVTFSLGVATSRSLLQTSKCPPPGFNSVRPFSIAVYISDPWYPQMQMPLSYQPINALYCVRARYVPRNPCNLLDGLWVDNSAKNGSITGEFSNLSPFPIVATVPNANFSSELEVGIFVAGAQRSFGDYWVVEAGTSPERVGNSPARCAATANPRTCFYDWAIVTGGPPTRRTEFGCATGKDDPEERATQVDDIGFWLFTRKPVDPVSTAIMLQKAEKLGLDTTVLVNVTQEGCTYAPLQEFP